MGSKRQLVAQHDHGDATHAVVQACRKPPTTRLVKAGSRRVAFEDLIAYARKMREQQEAALERMAENARELGLDY